VSPVKPVSPANLGSGDRAAWPDLIGYGTLALSVWVVARVVGARARRRGWLAVVLGAVICLVPLWFLFENVVRLLPPNV
jgi:hypothetical protein